MKIKSLEASGFKSFCDKTKVIFDNALTAVVGPNGCGKSNIVDAIRWALGEQSARNLRGKGMGDVIFNGSERRGPQSIAEVTITFDNTDGLSHPLYVEYPEVAITRRLHRDGTSEYLINKVPCRLKDISELFMGTGGGARAYSIIEQGRIGLIVSSRSEDRRGMIEEAAGITRFKKARQTAQRKMEQTRQNMLRINDVVAEMGRSLESLKRQARKAERYNLYAREQRDKEMYLASHRYMELLTERRSMALRIDEARVVLGDIQRGMEVHEARVEELKIDEVGARTDLDQAKRAANDANNCISVLETEIHHLEGALARTRAEESSLVEQLGEYERRRRQNMDERDILSARMGTINEDSHVMTTRREEAERRANDARERLAEMGRDYDSQRDGVGRARARIAAAQSASGSLDQRIAELQSRIEETQAERQTLDERRCGVRDRVGDLEIRCRTARGQYDEVRKAARAEGEALEVLREDAAILDGNLAQVKDDLSARSHKLASLRDVEQSMGRSDNGVRQAVEALRREDMAGFDGMLVDYVRCDSAYELPLAVVLNDKLEAIVTADENKGLALLAWLKERDMGRICAVARDVMDIRRDVVTSLDDSRVHGALYDFLTVDEAVRFGVANLLRGVFVVSNAPDAVSLWKQYKGRAAFVSLDGQYVDFSGVVSGGRAGTAGADILEQKRLIRELATQVTALREERDTLENRFAHLKEELCRRQNASEQARNDAQRAEFELAQLEKDRERAGEDLENAIQRNSAIEQDLDRQQRQLDGLSEDRATVKKELADAHREVDTLSRGIEEMSERIAGFRDEADRLAAEVTDARVMEAQFVEQRQAAMARSTQIVDSEREIEDGIARIAKRQLWLAKEQGKVSGQIVASKEALIENLANVHVLTQNVDRNARYLDDKLKVLEASSLALKERRGQADVAKEKVSALQMDCQKIESDIAHLLSTVEEKHDVMLPRVLGDYHLRPIPDEAVVHRIEELKEVIGRMGAINPTAIDEYTETSARYEEKLAQKEDVEQALEDLEAAISRMDRDSKRLFKETFDAVNASFQKIFPRLFRGGSARLALTDPDDLLTTGVDIVASPPGKKLGAIELMSGGEKALTAVSLLFAIFLQRPSPFCLLDEVDAPLDDANIARMVEMLREMTDRTQFVIITHSNITMEGADALYGVTMQEPGVSKVICVNLVHNEPGMATGS